MNANPRATGREPTPRSPSRRYRDQAWTRLSSARPDAGFHRAGRRRWRARVARLARVLDELEPGETILGPVLELAFRAFLPLADPAWWRAHPKARLNAAARRQLREIERCRRRARRGAPGGGRRARRGWAATALGRLELRAWEAAAIYARHGDRPAFDLCGRLSDLLDEAFFGAGGGGRRGPEGSAGPRRGPADDNRRSRPLRGPLIATTPGPAVHPVPGKEVDL